MREALSTLSAPTTQPATPFKSKPGAQRNTLGMVMTGLRNLVTSKPVIEASPVIGGTAGGIVGGVTGGIPGAVAGATIGGSGGEAVKQLYQHATGDPNAPRSSGDAAKGIATQGAIQGAIEGTGGLITKGVSKAATAVYRGYLKPSLAGTELAKAREIVDTAIRENLPITAKGEARAKLLISQINNQVNLALKNAALGKPVDLTQIANKVRAFARRVYGGPGAPKGDLAAALKVADDIDSHASLFLPSGAKLTTLTPAKANKTKQALDKAIGDTGFGVERGAATEARKVGRYATRQAIEDVVPAVKGLNKRESEIIDALESVSKAVGRESNKDQLIGMRSLAALGIGGGAYGGTDDATSGLVVAAGTRVGLSPALMSKAAIYANKFAKVPGTGAVLAARMGLLIALRESDESKDE